MVKINTLTLGQTGFPQRLAQIPDPPKQLFVIGDNFQELLKKPCLAIVGSRKVSVYGRSVTAHLGEEVARAGVVIISGLAIGLDGLAHQAALNANMPTIAVLPCGIGSIYPSTHHHLAKQILNNGGALVSEYAPGTAPHQGSFIARNRLISGLSDAVLIPEAAEKSGSLHTANFALEQGRDVLAVPGNITGPTSSGTNNLIKTGAITVTCAADILLIMKIDQKALANIEVSAANAEEYVLIKLLQDGVSDSSALLAQSQLSPSLFNQTLTMLEITGRIRSLGASHWTLS